jgi:uncharacterized protein DUF1553/uncharacterized protein DUF1549/cytochrome c
MRAGRLFQIKRGSVRRIDCIQPMPFFPSLSRVIFAGAAFLASASLAAPATVDFNRDIQPILSENCYQCHGPDKGNRKGDLRLDVEKDAKARHDDATPIIPQHSAESELIRRILTREADDLMPPAKSHKKLTAAQIETLKHWVDEGAVWGVHWSFLPVKKPAVPPVSDAKFKIQNPIDAFVLARLQKEKLSPSPEASKETLIRRVTLDLTGLPPMPEELDAFLHDASPQAYEHVVDRLLNSPRYGERWCWDWLDAARYSDTNGYQGDPERTMWPWRDWVVRALNANMPFDQFTVWQMAGDLLPNPTTEQKLATGFNRNHMMNGEGGRIAEESRVENVMDRVETASTLWLGLTMGCSKCHDHKFDPVTMRDYYGLYDFFNQTSETGALRGGQAPPALDMSTPAELERSKAAQEKLEKVAQSVVEFELKKFPRPEGKPLSESDAQKLPGNLPRYIADTEPKKRGVDALLESVNYFKGKDDAYAKELEHLLKAVRVRDAANKSVTRVMVMDTLPQPRDTFMLVKGAYDKATDVKVTALTPATLPPMKPEAPKNRLGLAQWLVSRENPLTSRVTVNRFWQSFFGIGLVKTTEDFGAQGEKPSHPELLDWLAAQFMDSGWDVKALHRLIVTSSTYRQSSKVTPLFYERDPENRLLSRGARFRLPSWMIRDVALSASGLLETKSGGPSVKPYQPEGIWEEATFGKIGYQQDHADSLYRRSLYTYWRRIVGPTMFFDNASRQYCAVRTLRTNTPLHALTTLNDVQYVEAARALAQRVMLANTNDAARLDHTYRLTLARRAKPDETALLLQRLEYLKTQFSENKESALNLLAVGESPHDPKLDPTEHAAWTALCELILNLDEAISKE